jgi:hypothetical protein
MRKILTLMSMICIIMFTNYTAHAVAIDASSSGNWSGYMAWFETDVTTKGNYSGGENWGVADLNASYTADSFTLSPNTNAYADNIGSADPNAVAYWTNGDDGNKWMVATYKLEAAGDNQAWKGQTLTFSGTINGFTLDSRYSTVAFIKTLDVNNNWNTVQNEEVAISATGDFNLSLDVLSGAYVAQIGFTMSGINANPATDWGNVQLTNLNATAVPEPSTYALILGLASFLFLAIRRRK